MGEGLGLDIKPEYKEMFLEESNEQVEEWEDCLLNLAKDSSDKELINRLFRAIHTLKGIKGIVRFCRFRFSSKDNTCHRIFVARGS